MKWRHFQTSSWLGFASCHRRFRVNDSIHTMLVFRKSLEHSGLSQYIHSQQNYESKQSKFLMPFFGGCWMLALSWRQVSRTFSKTWGFPSLRLGYLLSTAANVNALTCVRGPYETWQSLGVCYTGVWIVFVWDRIQLFRGHVVLFFFENTCTFVTIHGQRTAVYESKTHIAGTFIFKVLTLLMRCIDSLCLEQGHQSDCCGGHSGCAETAWLRLRIRSGSHGDLAAANFERQHMKLTKNLCWMYLRLKL